MLPFFGKKKEKPKTDAEILQEAFGEVESSQKKRTRRKRRSLLWRKYADPRILIVFAIIVMVLIADGVRRENMEFYATVAELSGPGIVTLGAREMPQPLALDQRIEDGGRVSTGANCWVSLNFPDGSVVTLAPCSELVVELLEYHRGGMWRSRAFTLKAGHMWARISPNFGQESTTKVHTPSSVAAVRGTRFCMFYDPNRSETSLSCNDGAVRVDGFRGDSVWVVGGRATSVEYGAPPVRVSRMDNQTRQTFGSPSLNEQIEPDPWLKRTSMGITSVLDLPLSMLGIGKSSWAIGAADFARRNAAMEAMRRIHTSIEGYRTYPDFVDPFTLAELDFRPRDAVQILKNFDGRSLVKYQRVGQSFVIYARGRDKARTPFRLTAYGVEQITEEEMPGF
ncbi:MAG: FecR family protein [Armatimonadota bacterium]